MNSIDKVLSTPRLLRISRGTTVLFLTVVFGVFAGVAGAQVNVFPGGGGTATSSQHTASVTLGQAIIGPAQAAGHSAQSGFQSVLDREAPGGSLPPASAAAGSDAQISVVLEDGGSVLAATLYYRVGGQVGFTEIAMEEGVPGSGDWAAAIPAADVTSKGVLYYVVATDGINEAFFPAGAPAEPANLTVALTDHPVISTVGNQYGMYGLPMVAADDSPLAVFSQLGSYDRSAWRFGIYSPAAESYREGAAAGDCVPGQGFWLITKAARAITATGTNTPLGSAITLALGAGFNQIANPYDFPINWSDVYPGGGVVDYLYGWNGTGYDGFSHTIMEPGRGYWVVNASKSNTLSFAPVPAGVAKAKPALSTEILADSEPGWSVHAVLTAAGFTDGNNRFGLRDGATADQDAFDFLDAPPPPGDHVSLSLLMQDGRRLLSDYRDPDSDGEAWKLLLSSDQDGADFRVDFRADRQAPEGWRLLAIDLADLKEVDLTGGGALTGRIGSGDFAHTWLLVAGDEAFLADARDETLAEFNQGITSFSLRPAYPNPFGGGNGTLIAFTVPKATTASLRVYDLHGRVVKTLYSGGITQGLYQFDWLGRDEAGRRAASGIYFMRLTTPETTLIQKVMFVR